MYCPVSLPAPQSRPPHPVYSSGRGWDKWRRAGRETRRGTNLAGDGPAKFVGTRVVRYLSIQRSFIWMPVSQTSLLLPSAPKGRMFRTHGCMR